MQLGNHLLPQFISISRTMNKKNRCCSCKQTNRCFFSAAARAVASSMISGRNGIIRKNRQISEQLAFISLPQRSDTRRRGAQSKDARARQLLPLRTNAASQSVAVTGNQSHVINPSSCFKCKVIPDYVWVLLNLFPDYLMLLRTESSTVTVSDGIELTVTL